MSTITLYTEQDNYILTTQKANEEKGYSLESKTSLGSMAGSYAQQNVSVTPFKIQISKAIDQ